MSHHGPIARFLAVVLVAIVPLALTPAAAADDAASLAGTIFALEDKQPVDGAVLHAGNVRTGEIYSSPVTGKDGAFTLSGLPAAAYDLAVETDEGLYLVGTKLPLDAGQKRDVHFGLSPAMAAADDPKTAHEKKNDDMGLMDNPLFATLTVIGSSLLFGYFISELDDTDQLLISPFIL